MSAEESSSKVVEAFPLPPDYYMNYVDDVDSNNWPTPPAPIQGEYEMFGAKYTTDKPAEITLKEAGVDQLVPDGYQQHEIPSHLNNLHWNLMEKYSELIDTVCDIPEDAQKKVEEIRTILLNMHFLINSYRPTQAKLDLMNILNEQLTSKQNCILEGKKALQAADDCIKRILISKPK